MKKNYKLKKKIQKTLTNYQMNFIKIRAKELGIEKRNRKGKNLIHN